MDLFDKHIENEVFVTADERNGLYYIRFLFQTAHGISSGRLEL